MSKRFWGADSVCWILSLARILDGPEPVVLFDMGETPRWFRGCPPPLLRLLFFSSFVFCSSGWPARVLFFFLRPCPVRRPSSTGVLAELQRLLLSCLSSFSAWVGAPPFFLLCPFFCLSLSLARMQHEYLRMVTSRETLMETTDKSFVSPG